MAASGTCLQVFTASNLIYVVHNESVLWNSYLEATEEERELTWARIADIFGLKTRSSDNNVTVIVIHF